LQLIKCLKLLTVINYGIIVSQFLAINFLITVKNLTAINVFRINCSICD